MVQRGRVKCLKDSRTRTSDCFGYEVRESQILVQKLFQYLILIFCGYLQST